MEQNTADLFKQALAKFRSKDVKAGLDDLEEAIRLDPSRWELYWTRGAFNHRRRAYRLAEVDLTKAIDLCAEVKLAEKVYRRRMICYGHLKRYDSLAQDATWLIEHGFGDVQVYWWRGWGRYNMEEIDGAIDDYSRALDLLPFDYDLRHSRAAIYYRLRRYREALPDLNFMLTEMGLPIPIAAFFHLFRALVFYQLGEFEKSFEDYHHFQQHVPQLAGKEPFPSVQSYITGIHERIDTEKSFSQAPYRPDYGKL